MSKHVFVGMSGGVDSSVTAHLLLEQGYKVTGVYMKNWAQDIEGFICPWEQDLNDASAVATQLDIPLLIFDFEKDYKQRVVDYMIEAYKNGLTPNPDVMCNQEIKFKLFLEAAKEKGADMIATGHYARIKDGKLLRGLDDSKDQSYFLYRVTSDALKQSLFPVGEYHKKEIREIAKKRGLITAGKKDSVGICFVGQVGIKEFLSQYVETEPGPIIDQHGTKIGKHEGAIFYTIGQRHGLGVGGGLPYYVVAKDVDKNELYVTTNLDDERLWSEELKVTSLHWINQPPVEGSEYTLQVRYRSLEVKATILSIDDKLATLKLHTPQKAVAAGQSAVIYNAQEVLGGGVITV